MTLAITNADRYQVLVGYHHDIFSAIEKRQFQRAMRLLFAFAEDYCLNFESDAHGRHIRQNLRSHRAICARMAMSDVAALSEKYQQVINESGDEALDPLSFVQAFHRLWIAMEDDVLTGFPSGVLQESAPNIAAGATRPGEAGSYADVPVGLKKAILLRSPRRPLVQLNDVTISFGTSNRDFTLGPVTLQVPQGQIIGVVGPNGSGKTTLLRLIAADLMQSSGEIDFLGLLSSASTDLTHAHGFWPSVRSKIAYVSPRPDAVSQNTELTLWMTGAAHGIPSTQLEHQISVAMHKYGLNQYSNRLVSELSTGYRLRFELARILFTEPSLLVLDEPLANLDRNAQLTVLEDLKMLSASVENPRSIVVSSQHIESIASISDYLVFLADGNVKFKGPREEVANALDYALFEFTVADRLNEFEALLKTCGAIETQRTAVSVLALFPKEADAAMLHNRISQADLRVTTYRDLSNSAEAMLLMSRFRTPRDSSMRSAAAVEKTL